MFLPWRAHTMSRGGQAWGGGGGGAAICAAVAYGTSGWNGLNCCCDGGGDADSRAGLSPKAGVACGVDAGVWPGVTAPPAANNCWMWCVRNLTCVSKSDTRSRMRIVFARSSVGCSSGGRFDNTARRCAAAALRWAWPPGWGRATVCSCELWAAAAANNEVGDSKPG